MPRFTIPADHPSLPGHFPGRPVVPGVVALDHAVARVLDAIGGVRLLGFASVKFLAPILPDRVVEVVHHRIGTDRVDFACVSDGATALRGTARIGAA